MFGILALFSMSNHFNMSIFCSNVNWNCYQFDKSHLLLFQWATLFLNVHFSQPCELKPLTILILVTRQSFKITIPGKLCQNVDLFVQEILISFSRKNCGILRNIDITWSTVSPEFNLVTVSNTWAWKFLQKTLFFSIISNSSWPFRQVWRIVNKN